MSRLINRRRFLIGGGSENRTLRSFLVREAISPAMSSPNMLYHPMIFKVLTVIKQTPTLLVEVARLELASRNFPKKYSFTKLANLGS